MLHCRVNSEKLHPNPELRKKDLSINSKMTIRIIDHVMKSRQNTEIPYTCLEVRTRVYLAVSPRRGIYLAPVYFL